MKKYIITLLTILLFTVNSKGQGNTPCSAVPLPVNATCVYTNGTTVGSTYATTAANFGTPSCATPGAGDVWYKFVATSTNVIISTNTGTITDGGMSLYSATACGGTYTQLLCDDDTGPGLMPEISQTGLTIGLTYYIRFWKYSSGTGTFTICVSSPPIPVAPVNDLCANATVLPCGTVNLAGTTVGTTNIPIVSGCSMSNYGVWYTFVGDGQITTISTNPSFDIKLSVASGTCASMTNIICTDVAPETGTFTTVLGTTYYVYVGYWSTSGTTTGTFTISRSCTAPPVPTCIDGIQNGTETGIDCGGTCPVCVVGHNMGTGNLNACTGAIFDIGGNTGDYTNNENFTETYCSDAGNCIRVTFTSFVTETGLDKLTIYDGPTTASPVIGTYSGSSLPNGGIITSSSGCLTFKFVSDGSVVHTGWRGAITCIPCPVPTCSDGIQNGTETAVDCGGTCPVCPSTYTPVACTNTTYTLTTLNSVTFYDDGGPGGDPCADMAPGNFSDANCFTTVTICGAVGEYIIANFREFAMFNTTSGFDWMVIYDNNTTSGTILFDNRSTGPNNPLGECGISGNILNYCSAGRCLTFQFWATGVVNRAGWDCLVSSVKTQCVLPIELLDFTGYNKNNINKLQWTTLTETNNDYFTLDRSIDATNWFEIGKVNGSGNSSEKLTYNFDDDSFMSGVNYYKLTQTDFNGANEEFPIIFINSNQTRSKLLYTIDLIGRRVSENYNGFRIDVYEDGTVVPRTPKNNN